MVEIGAGAFSRVYRGQWNGEDVAVKVLTDGVSQAVSQTSDLMSWLAGAEVSLQVLSREADGWSSLNHPRIHKFFRACPTGNPPFLVSALHLNGDALKYIAARPDVDRLPLVYTCPTFTPIS